MSLNVFLDFVNNYKSELFTAFIGIMSAIGGYLIKVLYEKYTLSYKMKQEYDFKQKKEIKEKLALTRTPLVKSAEELNYRLWNFKDRIDKKWHNLDEREWRSNKYYLKSFVYRFLVFIYWILKAEESIYKFDLRLADKDDLRYLKYIKTLKHFFCESLLLKELGYTGDVATNHFYRDNLGEYSKYILKGDAVIDYDEFVEKHNQNYDEIKPVIEYIANIKNTPENLNLNVIRPFHLFLILFLNKYGLSYHRTHKCKIYKLMRKEYADIRIVKGMFKFFERNKVLKEADFIIKAYPPSMTMMFRYYVYCNVRKILFKLKLISTRDVDTE